MQADEDLNTRQPDTTIAQVLTDRHPRIRFRAAFRNHPRLRSWTVHSVLDSAESLNAFLQECRSLPQFGDVQERRLRDILYDLARTRGRLPAKPCRKQALDSAKRIELTGTFHPDFISAWSDVYRRAWRLTHFDAFLYVPSSIPEFVKHPEVLRAEIGPEIDLSEYTSQCAELRESLFSVTRAEGLVLIDRTRLDMVFRCHGPYAGLSTDTLKAQCRMLRELDSLLPSSVNIRVCDVEAARLTSCSVIGDVITLAVAGGYLVTRDKALRTLLEKRCASALKGTCSLAAYLADGPDTCASK